MVLALVIATPWQAALSPHAGHTRAVQSETEQGSGILPLVHALGTGTDLGKQREEKNSKIFLFSLPETAP